MPTPGQNKPASVRTEYGGITFRSRLEARWAVFFDALGIRYFYEPHISSLRCFPDFWLPSLQAYIEIKPNSQKKDARAETKARDLAKYTKKRVYLFFSEVQPPNLGDGKGSAWVFYPDREEAQHHWCECPKCGHIAIAPYRGSITDWSCSACGHSIDYTDPLLVAFQSSRLMMAYRTAQARFPVMKVETEAAEWDSEDWAGDDEVDDEDYDAEANPSIWDLAPEMHLEWEDWETEEDEEDDRYN